MRKNERTNKQTKEKKSRLQFLHIDISSESLYKEDKSQDYKNLRMVLILLLLFSLVRPIIFVFNRHEDQWFILCLIWNCLVDC